LPTVQYICLLFYTPPFRHLHAYRFAITHRKCISRLQLLTSLHSAFCLDATSQCNKSLCSGGSKCHDPTSNLCASCLCRNRHFQSELSPNQADGLDVVMRSKCHD
jgi:hypothetical protein